MIGSLANFLMVVLYPGPYPERVAWIIWMFTMGTVALARLAIEQSRERSLAYALGLGAAGFVVMARFFGSPVFSLFILGLIGYLSDVIVRDCTIIDDQKDASGRGLFDRGFRFWGGPKEQPGRTVMWLALAALPLFGLGQFAIRDPLAQTASIKFLAIYLFASLSLLVTTSFLGLRRYLRQRQADMPADVSIGWLVGGVALVALVLTATFLMPLPGRAVAVLPKPGLLEIVDDLSPSRFGWGSEGTEKQSPEASRTASPSAETPDSSPSTDPQGQPGSAPSGDQEQGPSGSESSSSKSGASAGGRDGSATNQERQARSQADDPSRGQDSQGNTRRSDAEGREASQTSRDSAPTSGDSGQSQADPATESSQQPGESSGERSESSGDRSESSGDRSESSGDQSERSQQTGNEPNSTEQTGPESEPNRGDQSSPSDQGDESSPPSRSAEAAPSRLSWNTLGGLLRWILVIVLAIIPIVYLWLHRDALAQWLRSLGRRPSAADDEPLAGEFVAAETYRSFSSFRNPIGKERDARRVVVVTFQALEAWMREHGCQRSRDETPSEYVRRVGHAAPELNQPVSELVDAYNRIVYGRGNATRRDLDAAERVWAGMRSR